MIRRAPRPSPRRVGFTLIELLVVITIIVLVSAVTLPTVLPALNHRQVGEAARILQAALVGARDAAIRDNAPRGIRLLPDPIFNGSTTTLAYNRFVPIEPAPDYAEGTVADPAVQRPTRSGLQRFPPPKRTAESHGPGPITNLIPITSSLTMRSVLIDRAITLSSTTTAIPNERTSWFWNIRVGDKIQFGDSGRYYTIVGPMVINPLNPNTLGQNPELFVNVGRRR